MQGKMEFEPPEVLRQYLAGVISVEECNAKLEELGLVQMPVEYENGQDTTTGFRRKE